MTASADDPAFADLLDDLLEQFLNAEAPDVAAVAQRHPRAAHRLDEALALAGGLAGRKVAPRPSLQGYEVVRELGRGGMGTVYLARQLSLGREVALKVLPHSFGLSAASRQRFLQEARALARVKHRHIVDIHRIVDDGELLAFEMEFVEGPSLHAVLQALRQQRADARRGPRTPPTLAQLAAAIGLAPAQLGARNPTQFFVQLALKVARALAAVHAAGFVHRDVKPANLLLRADGEPVVVDFGLVRSRGLDVSHAAGFAGTPVYSSPEQLRGEAVGPASDVYSLGVTLYECLTLATPFAGRTTTELLQRIETGRGTPLRRLAPEAPRDLETVVAHAMEIDPRQRYEDAAALADDLQRLLDLQPIQALPVHPLRRLGKFLRRHQRSWLAAAAGAVLVGIAAVPIVQHVAAASRRHEESARAAAEHVATARQHVLSLDAAGDWRRAVWGERARARLATNEERLAPLRSALDAYARALAIVPDDARVQREADVTGLAMWLQQLTVSQTDTVAQALVGGEFARLTASLGPATVAAARAFASGAQLGSPAHDDHAPGDPDRGGTDRGGAAARDDRTTLGLLAFVLGDFRGCEAAWGGLEPDAASRPLVDAGLGLLLLADGTPAAAYARLAQAQRHDPGSATLALAIAEAALRLGDLDDAARWLARAPANADPARRRLLELDLRAACEPGADLAPAYAELAAASPDDPVVRHRLAQLALRRGDLQDAERRLDELLASWPDAAPLQLDRARTALQRRDLAGYARQVLAVLDRPPGSDRARGATADRLEVLRIGGLERSWLAAVAASGGTRSGRAFAGGELPIHAFAPAAARTFEELVHVVHDVRRATRAWRERGLRLPAWAEHTFVSLPTALARAPVGALPGPGSRVLLAAVPAAVAWLDPTVSVLVHAALVRLPLHGWRSLPLDVVAGTDELPPALLVGHALARVGDATADGVDDVLVACATPQPDEATGRLLLVDGRTAATVAVVAGPDGDHLFAHSVAGVGDHDGDGRADWLVGAPSGDADARHGRAELWSSARRQPIARVDGEEPGFGVSVAGLGDADGDGVPEFAVGAPPFLRNTAAQGNVRVYSGRTRALLHTFRSDVAGVWFGACIANAGDADGDGVDDLVVGGNFGGAPGLVRLYSTRSGAVLQQWSDAAADTGFGTVVCGIGDADGDGRADVAIAAVRREERAGASQVVLCSGGTGRQLAVLASDRPGTAFGSAIVPYVRRAGEPVLAIGVPADAAGGAGAVQLWSVRGRLLSTVLGPAGHGAFGSHVALVQDVDGDGRPELFVAAPGSGGRGSVCRVRSAGVQFGWR